MAKKPAAIRKNNKSKQSSESSTEESMSVSNSTSESTMDSISEERQKSLLGVVDEIENETAVDLEDDESIEEETQSGSDEDVEDKDDEVERTIFIKGLDYDVEEDQLREQMEKIGSVVRVTIPKTHDGRRNKGFGYVEFEKIVDAKKALKLNDTELLGRKVSVNVSRPKGQSTIFTVFVRNLSFDMTKDELLEYFSKFGNIHNISVPTDPENENRNRGYAFVEYTDEALANKVAEAKHKYKDRILYTSFGNKNKGGDKMQKGGNNKRGGDRFNKGGDKFNKGGDRFNKGGNKSFDRKNGGNNKFKRENDGFDRKSKNFKSEEKSGQNKKGNKVVFDEDSN